MPTERSDPPQSEREMRSEIGAILDQLQSLPSDAFAERSRLQDRKAELVQALRRIEIPGSEAISRRWAEQAGTEVTENLGHPEIISPTESGSSGM